jgi:acyl-CoA thioesterase II
MTEVVSAWSKYPGYVISVEPLQGVGRARLGDTLVAESNRCLVVRESDHRDQLYFPLEDIMSAVMVESDHHTICPFKGEASYSNLSVAGSQFENSVWWYPTPMSEVAALTGYAAFSTEQVEVSASVAFDDDGEATTCFPPWGTADDLAALMDVTRLDDATFSAPPYPNPPIGTFLTMDWHKQRRIVVEGGQLLGAAIIAASKCRPDQRVASANIAFVKSASFDEPVVLEIDTRHRGSTLSLFDIRIEQAGSLRASALVMSDSGSADLIRHSTPMPEVPPPAECPHYDFGVLGREIRVVEGAYSLGDDNIGPPVLYIWTRFARAPATTALHQALVAQATTHYSIGAALRPHAGISESEAHRTVSMGPISASIAFHDDFDVTDWLLTETQSIWAGRGSTQSQVRVFNLEGRVVASKTMQAIVRSFDRTPEQLGQDYSTVM